MQIPSNPLRIPLKRKIIGHESLYPKEFHQILFIWKDYQKVFREFDVIYIVCGETATWYDKPFWYKFLIHKPLMPIIGPCPGCKLYLKMELSFTEYIFYNNMMEQSFNRRTFSYKRVKI